MSTLTKICIVLVFVLSLLACVVFYQEVVTSRDWKLYAQQQERRANTAETEIVFQHLAAANWREQAGSLKKDVADRERQLLNERDSSRGEISRLTVQNTQLQGDLKVLAAQVSKMEGALQLQVARNEQLFNQLASLRQDKNKIEDELRQLKDVLAEKQDTIDRGERQRRVLEEDIAAKTQEIKDLQKRIADLEVPGRVAARVAPEPGVGAPKVEASVTAVQENLASLNVGSASKVEKGWVFILYRGGDLVGYLRVADVGTTSCAGIVFDALRDVQVGDKATNKLE